MFVTWIHIVLVGGYVISITWIHTVLVGGRFYQFHRSTLYWSIAMIGMVMGPLFVFSGHTHFPKLVWICKILFGGQVLVGYQSGSESSNIVIVLGCGYHFSNRWFHSTSKSLQITSAISFLQIHTFGGILLHGILATLTNLIIPHYLNP